MVWLASPTTVRSSRSPNQAESTRCCRGVTSWYSSTTKHRYRSWNSSATAASFSIAAAVCSNRSSKSSKVTPSPRALSASYSE
ncbi:Uncharacterised protein [Mycobacterium tuberculosis]|uniref:Uncharacterized protein n=1 Tax=Mycobacterium tuberculosis TaxID=1773 RepID=A0A655IMH5_MYCTX|nr:Uncharacterised protein [Mycobacterium tuberculosis]CNN06446.1 Uncharacterised protein [Mycobacterium tuberculosis]COW03668.1 Uncharacterised protein [Mycobacterium tuberculosis]COX23736.1 Uncharacterised protein [Mycobacterium tuberculosis]COX72280.1 Uncharacterised protein [Mycobacterium tuberculosis]